MLGNSNFIQPPKFKCRFNPGPASAINGFKLNQLWINIFSFLCRGRFYASLPIQYIVYDVDPSLNQGWVWLAALANCDVPVCTTRFSNCHASCNGVVSVRGFFQGLRSALLGLQYCTGPNSSANKKCELYWAYFFLRTTIKMRGLTLILLTAFILVLALANCQTVTTEGEWITDNSNPLMRWSYQYLQALLNKRKKGE